MESLDYKPTITLGNILTIISLVCTVIYSYTVISTRFEEHIVLARNEHERFVQKEAMDVWKEYVVSSITEMKSDIKDIKKAVR